MNNPEATQQALSILRNGETFQWYVLPLFALVLYIYFNEISKKNWKGVAAGLALYMVHWLYEIGNALIQHFSGHALWTVPTGTAFLLLVGVGIELSMMFSIAGLVMSKLLPADPKAKLLGINNRLVFAIGNAAFAGIPGDISSQNTRFCLGLSMVGRFACNHPGIYPLFPGSVLLLRLETDDPAPVYRRFIPGKCSCLDLICWNFKVDIDFIYHRN